MKILGFEFGKQPQPMTQTVKIGNNVDYGSFSTSFLQIGPGNLSLPHINRYYTQNGIVRFGEDNLYSQLLNQMYYTSAIHGGIIDTITNATIGGSYSWKDEKLTASESVKIKVFEKVNKFKKLARLLTRDYVIHSRVTVLIIKNLDGSFKSMKRLDPSTIRNNELNTKFVYANDWSRGSVGLKEFTRYDESAKTIESLYVYQDETPGQDIYPIPRYNSILNWAYLDGEQAFFHKSNIQNSVFPSLAIKSPKKFETTEEIEQFKAGIKDKTGAKNAGRVLVLTGNGMDDVPDVVPISANNNDKLFDTTSKELKDNIAFAHMINPSIMGVKVAGSLGNAEELKMSYSIFEKNVIMPLREVMLEIFNDLVDIANVQNTIEINDFQIIDSVIQESGQEFTIDLKKK